MNRNTKSILHFGQALLAMLGLGLGTSAMAERIPVPAGAPKSFQTECGSCHMAFPPALLSAADWRRVMAGLARHYGTDASLDARSAAEIRTFLERNAGPAARTQRSADPPRITKASWFKHQHGEVPVRLWTDPRVKSAANCAACHRGAESGRFSENEFALPELRERGER